MAAMNEPEGLVVTVLALASAEVAAKATPKTTDSAMRFVILSSRCAAMAAVDIDVYCYRTGLRDYLLMAHLLRIDA